MLILAGIRRTPQGVRGLKLLGYIVFDTRTQSHSARSAWIETAWSLRFPLSPMVALRKECVD
mgnify:CR=1